MWFEITFNEYCAVCETDDEYFYCLVHNGSEGYYEKQPLEIIFQRAKECNKRIHYDEMTIKTTLHKLQPILALLNAKEETPNVFTLNLKYKVQLHPFNFYWNLSKQSIHELHNCVFHPILKAVRELCEENIELRNAVRKKDTEISQYKLEGAVLKRTTVATTKFDFHDFDEKYSVSKLFLKSLELLAGVLKDETVEERNNNNSLPASPQQKKKKHQLEYESSDSDDNKKD